jgi:hypothetical protein
MHHRRIGAAFDLLVETFLEGVAPDDADILARQEPEVGNCTRLHHVHDFEVI